MKIQTLSKIAILTTAIGYANTTSANWGEGVIQSVKSEFTTSLSDVGSLDISVDNIQRLFSLDQSSDVLGATFSPRPIRIDFPAAKPLYSFGATATPPSLSVGCDGIDLNLGSFSIAGNIDFSVEALEQIMTGAAVYFFNLAMSAISEQITSIINDAMDTIHQFGQQGMSTCQLGQGIATYVADDIKGAIKASKQGELVQTAVNTGNSPSESMINTDATNRTDTEIAEANRATIVGGSDSAAKKELELSDHWTYGNMLGKIWAGQPDRANNLMLASNALPNFDYAAGETAENTQAFAFHQAVVGTVVVTRKPTTKADGTPGVPEVAPEARRAVVKIEDLAENGLPPDSVKACPAFKFDTESLSARDLCEFAVTNSDINRVDYQTELINIMIGFETEADCVAAGIASGDCNLRKDSLIDAAYDNTALVEARKEKYNEALLWMRELGSIRLVSEVIILAMHDKQSARDFVTKHSRTLAYNLAKGVMESHFEALRQAVGDAPLDIKPYADTILENAEKAEQAMYDTLAADTKLTSLGDMQRELTQLLRDVRPPMLME